jgi:succinate dehydrogenase / fumarate reductase cytochrome b subunit
MFTSIVHRITGMGAGVGALLLVWWLMAAAAGPDYFSFVQGIFGSWYGRLVLFGVTWSLAFHMCNGIRHLVWDLGAGFELKTAHNSGVFTIIASVVLTLLVWAYGYWSLGAWS